MAMASGQFRIDEIISILERAKAAGFSVIDLSLDNDNPESVYLHGAGLSQGGDMFTGIGFDAAGLSRRDIITEAWSAQDRTESGNQYIERRKRELLAALPDAPAG